MVIQFCSERNLVPEKWNLCTTLPVAVLAPARRVFQLEPLQPDVRDSIHVEEVLQLRHDDRRVFILRLEGDVAELRLEAII